MPRLDVVAVPVLALGLALAPGASGQSTISAQAGLATVRFAGGSATGVLSFSPDFSYTAQRLQFSLGATVAAVPHNRGYGQLRFGAWLASKPISGKWRLAADAELTGTTIGGGHASGSGSITGEAVYSVARWGIALGAGSTSGSDTLTNSPSVTALHARLRGWWSDPASTTTLTGSIEPNRFLGSWYTEITGAWLLRRGRWTTQLTGTGRVSSTYVSRAAALFSVDYQLSSSWSVSVIGGNVLRDPYQGFPATAVLFAGARLQLPLHRGPRTAVVRGAGFAVTRGTDGVILVFERRGAQNVAIAGDWNGWLPTPLDTSRPDRWVVHLPLTPGVYHFTLLIDGSAWTIPTGVPSIPDGLGGRVAVLVVTP